MPHEHHLLGHRMTPPTTLLFMTLMLNTAAEAASSPTKSSLPAVCQYVSVASRSRLIVVGDGNVSSDAIEFLSPLAKQQPSSYPSLLPISKFVSPSPNIDESPTSHPTPESTIDTSRPSSIPSMIPTTSDDNVSEPPTKSSARTASGDSRFSSILGLVISAGLIFLEYCSGHR